MGTTRLQVYNAALRFCKERRLASLTEEGKARRLLDGVWDDSGVEECLEMAQWNFATRSGMLDYSPSIEPDFGYRRAFTKPTDWLLTSAVCSDEFFKVPLLQYVDEGEYWYADLDTIYVRYVSSDDSYGLNLGKWPASFKNFVAADFASKIITSLTNDMEMVGTVYKLREKALITAKSRDAMANPTQMPPEGSWSASRRAGRASRRDRGNRGNLIG
jgi:hypothetical protein